MGSLLLDRGRRGAVEKGRRSAADRGFPPGQAPPHKPFRSRPLRHAGRPASAVASIPWPNEDLTSSVGGADSFPCWDSDRRLSVA